MAAEIKEEYTSSLADLTMNSKPLINVLTMLAEENIAHADVIVEAVVSHLEKVRNEYKLPVLYLIDSIIKNVGGNYTNLFTQNIVSTFLAVFKKVDERTRAQMYKLRQTWNEVFPAKKLYALDVQVYHIDPAWPITAPPPTTHSIHVNPKFFNKPNVAITTIASTTSAITTTNATSTTTTSSTPVDPHIQEQLNSLNIKKQKLLELQREKVKLAKLQQKIHQLETHSVPKTPNQQLLLKPEVAKQLAGLAPLAAILPTEELKSVITKARPFPVMSKVKLSNSQVSSIGPRLTAVLPVTQRPALRDPRLLKQQAEPNNMCVESNVFHDNVSVVDRIKVTNTINVDCATNNKTLNNKPSARSSTFTTRDPRLVHSKIDDGKPSNSRRSPTSKSTTSTRKSSSKSSRSKSSSSSSEMSNSKTNSPSCGGKKAFKDDTNSDGAARKSRSPSKSPSKYKKRDGSSTRDDKRKSSKTDISKLSRRSGKDSGDSPQGFKDLKGSTKNRNYMRRNRTVSVSPETTLDVDLRVGAPSEKQIRLQTNTTSDTVNSKSTSDSNQVKDVDLRHLPAIVTKKRASTEVVEPNNAKKSKSEMFDILFGHEDVDLRQLPPTTTTTTTVQQSLADRPPTPPPPIISANSSNKSIEINDTDCAKKSETTSKTNLDALRLKLANATKGRDKDTDLRKINGTSEDVLNKIFISVADEQSIKEGNMSPAKYSSLINKVVEHFETQKLREAQQKDSESLAGISLQPISDDELSADFSHSDSEDEKEKSNKSNNDKYKDDKRRDEKSSSSNQNSSGTLGRTNDTHGGRDKRTIDPRLNNRKQGHWQSGVRRRTRKWDSPPPPPPPPTTHPWIRPPAAVHPYGPWRPANSPFIRPMIPETFGMPETIVITATVPEYHRVESPPALGQINLDLPLPDPVIIDIIEKDTMKNIQIDKIPRDIRFYDDVAVCIMNWDDPRQILFQNGSGMVTFNEKESFVLNFNEAYKEILINGNPHKVKFGAPTREIYIDGKFYDCQFGGPGIGIEIDGKMTVVKLEGQTPQVKIGQPRKDLVAGKINLIIDARSMVPVFLDPKPQRFDIEGKVHTLRFVDALQTVLINEVPFKVEFGGLPKPIQVYDKKHFIRFSVLPRGVKPGLIHIKNMEGYQPPAAMNSPPTFLDENSQDVPLLEVSGDFDNNTPALPMMGLKKHKQIDKDSMDDRHSPIVGNLHQQVNLSGLDILSSAMATPLLPPSNNYSGYFVENTNSRDTTVEVNECSASLQQEQGPLSIASFLPSNININDLFQKLVETGIVTSSIPEPITMVPNPQVQPVQVPIAVPKLPPIPKKNNFKPVLFSQPETLKVRQAAIITSLFTGMQCSSCGVRFPPEQSMYYSQHLDWHFRQNRRGKNSIRKAMSRRWYYSLTDWKNYEEIEDLEEREKSWFENQQEQKLEAGADEQEEEVEIPSVAADCDTQESSCEVCRDKFEQFYNEEKEEWHLRMAIRVDGKTYHPLCYEDHKNSLLNDTSGVDESDTSARVDESIDELENASDVEEELEKEQSEDATVVPEPNVSESKEDEKDDVNESTQEDVRSEDKENTVEDREKSVEDDEKVSHVDEKMDEDDDVIIHEVIPEKIDIANDDDDEKDYMGLIPGVVVKQEPIDDDFMEVDEVKIKNEPIDADLHVSKVNTVSADTTLAGMVSSMDGNVQLDSGIATTGGLSGKIKINITKSIVAPTPKEPIPSVDPELPLDCMVDPNEPLPPGEEPVQLNLKSALQGLTLKKQLPIKKGSELTGLCSIM